MHKSTDSSQHDEFTSLISICPQVCRFRIATHDPAAELQRQARKDAFVLFASLDSDMLEDGQLAAHLYSATSRFFCDLLASLSAADVERLFGGLLARAQVQEVRRLRSQHADFIVACNCQIPVALETARLTPAQPMVSDAKLNPVVECCCALDPTVKP